MGGVPTGEADATIRDRRWRRAFVLLASSELGPGADWAGPDDVEELRLRVDTLVQLLGLLPRGERHRLADIVDHLAESYPDNEVPDQARLRAGIRRLIGDRPDERAAEQQSFRRAALLLGGAGVPSLPDAGAPADRERCAFGLGIWFEQVRTLPKWNTIRLFESDVADSPIAHAYVELHTVPDHDVERSADGGTERVGRFAGRIGGGTHAAIDAAAMVARTSSFCVVVGDPGSGKSTLVRRIVRGVADRTIPDFDAALAVDLGPFALALAETPALTLVEHFFDSLGTRFDDWSGAAQCLRRAARLGGSYLLLLDGWDEVPEPLRDDVERRIAAERPFFTAIVTSRPSGFPRRFATGPRVELYHVAGLGISGRRRLIENCLRTVGRGELAIDVVRRIESSPDLRELASNPFLLTLLTRAAAAGGGLDPATDWTPAELYRQASGWIVESSASRFPGDSAALMSALRGLERLSCDLLFDDRLPRYVFARDELYDRCGDAAEPLLRSRFLGRVDVQASWYSFLHATFEEYFAARHAESLDERRLQLLLQRGFLSASRGVVLEFVVGAATAAGVACRSQLPVWFRAGDRYGQILLRVARLLAACPARARPRELTAAVCSGLWDAASGKGTGMDGSRRSVFLHARLDPVGLCRAARGEPSLDDSVVESICESIPAEIGIAERVSDFIDPQLRERVLPKLWGGRSDGERESDRRMLGERGSDPETLRRAIVAVGGSRDSAAVPLLIDRLREGTLSEALQGVAVTSLGLIGGTAASEALVDLVVGDIPAGYVPAGLARCGLMHQVGGHGCLEPSGRDKLLRRIACADLRSPRQWMLLSSLQGFPIRTGLPLLKHIGLHSGYDPQIRRACLDILGSALPDVELDELLSGIDSQPPDIENMLLSVAVQRSRAIPVEWLGGRLAAATRAHEMRRLLSVALIISARGGPSRPAADDLLSDSSRSALDGTGEGHVQLAAALEGALADRPAELDASYGWIEPALCIRILEGFVDGTAEHHVDRVLLAAALLGRVPVPASAALLARSLRACLDRAGEDSTTSQIDMLDEVARRFARSLADIDPLALLSFPADWKPVDSALSSLAERRGWLVFDDRILDAEGYTVQPAWQTPAYRLGSIGPGPAVPDAAELPLSPAPGSTTALRHAPRLADVPGVDEHIDHLILFYLLGCATRDGHGSYSEWHNCLKSRKEKVGWPRHLSSTPSSISTAIRTLSDHVFSGYFKDEPVKLVANRGKRGHATRWTRQGDLALAAAEEYLRERGRLPQW